METIVTNNFKLPNRIPNASPGFSTYVNLKKSPNIF